MSDPFIGEIRAFPYAVYIPRDWVLCDGRTLKVGEHAALFGVIGFTYGGDGKDNFAVPNLVQTVAAGVGAATGDPFPIVVELGKHVGSDVVSMSEQGLPKHTHQMEKKMIPGGAAAKTSKADAKSDLGQLTTGSTTYATFTTGSVANTILDSKTLAPAGTAVVQAHENRQPFLCLWYAIATEGLWPMRP
jgi:microcystin-dependent protein